MSSILGYGCGGGVLSTLPEPGTCGATANPLPSQIAAIVCALPTFKPEDWTDAVSFKAFASGNGKYLPVIGAMPKPEPNRATLGRAANGALITTHKKYIANLRPAVGCGNAKTFIDNLGNNWKGFYFWLMTDGGRIIGGTQGIKPAWIDSGVYYPEGRDSLEELYIDIEWYGDDNIPTAFVPGIGITGEPQGPPTDITDMLIQSFPDAQTNALEFTLNNGVLPTPNDARVWVFQNGNRLNPKEKEYSIIPNSSPGVSTVLINSQNHFNGADYVVSGFLS